MERSKHIGLSKFLLNREHYQFLAQVKTCDNNVICDDLDTIYVKYIKLFIKMYSNPLGKRPT